MTGLVAAALALLAASVAAQPAAPSLDAATLERATQLMVKAAAIAAPAGARVSASAGTLDPRLRLAACERVEAQLAPGAPNWGRTRVGLRCVQGPSAWNIYLPIQVSVMAPGLVATAALPAGTVIQPGHLVPSEVDWGADASPALSDAATAVGRTLLRPLGNGQALFSGQLKQRQWFAAGDTVRIVARGNGFSISGEGVALSNGLEGQAARVRTDNGRVLSGYAVAERRLEVAL